MLVCQRGRRAWRAAPTASGVTGSSETSRSRLRETCESLVLYRGQQVVSVKRTLKPAGILVSHLGINLVHLLVVRAALSAQFARRARQVLGKAPRSLGQSMAGAGRSERVEGSDVERGQEQASLAPGPGAL
jgi:hypothetical protein